MEKFKIGDRVRLERMESEADYYNKYLGQSFTIKNINPNIWGNDGTVDFVEYTEDNIRPYIKNLELVRKYNYKDLKKSPIGTKVTFENSLTLVKTKCNRLENDMSLVYTDELTDLQNEGLGKIIKIEEPEYRTVYEKEKEILDKEEKEYLSVVIKPFRNRVESIQKKYFLGKEYIKINIKAKIQGNSSLIDDILLPYFKQGTMYKGMKLQKEYTLKELGL